MSRSLFTLALAGQLFMPLVMIILCLVQRARMNARIVDEMNPKPGFFEGEGEKYCIGGP